MGASYTAVPAAVVVPDPPAPFNWPPNWPWPWDAYPGAPYPPGVEPLTPDEQEEYNAKKVICRVTAVWDAFPTPAPPFDSYSLDSTIFIHKTGPSHTTKPYGRLRNWYNQTFFSPEWDQDSQGNPFVGDEGEGIFCVKSSIEESEPWECGGTTTPDGIQEIHGTGLAAGVTYDVDFQTFNGTGVSGGSVVYSIELKTYVDGERYALVLKQVEVVYGVGGNSGRVKFFEIDGDTMGITVI